MRHIRRRGAGVVIFGAGMGAVLPAVGLLPGLNWLLQLVGGVAMVAGGAVLLYTLVQKQSPAE